MKRSWISLLLVALLFALLAMTGTIAETNDEVELVINDEELDLFSEPTYLDIPEEIEVSFGESELPEIKEIGEIMLDTSLDSMEPTTDPVSSAAVSNSNPDDFEIINGILVKYNGPGGDVVIPDGVTKIDKYAFKGSNISSIKIPDSVNSIGFSAFERCENLEAIVIPSGITCIESSTFYLCSKLANVTIPDSVTIIKHYAFYGCSNLASIYIPPNVTRIDNYAFSYCTSLKTFTFPNGLTSIGEGIFWFSTSIESVNIPESVTYIGKDAFCACEKLTSISIPDGIETIYTSTFSGCPNLASVILPKTIKQIDSFAFNGCMRLQQINLPINVSQIGESAFKDCYSLNKITIQNGNITINDSAFDSCPSTAVFFTPCESRATKWAISHGYTVDKSEHTPVTDKAVMPSCSETGLTEGSHCSVCGETLTAQQTIPAKGHTKVVDAAVAPTCTETGLTEGSHCSVCNTILVSQEVVPAKGHTPVTDKAVAATLTQTGLTEGFHCSVCGEVLVRQKVVPKLISIKKCSITGISDKVYAAKTFKPTPVVKYKGKALKKGTDYTVSYKDNTAVGTATITITGKGKYGASVNKTFKINPKPVALSSLTAGSKMLTVKWKKGKNITGYEVQYSLKKSFASAKKVTITKAGTVNTVLKNLQPKKTYYVRIRTYKTVKGKKYYSTWSKAKSAKPTK